MRSHRLALISACLCLVGLVAACRGEQSTDTTQIADETTTTTLTTTSAPTDALFETLTDVQREVVNDVCTGEFFYTSTYIRVISGESGVSDLEDLFIELGEDASNNERAQAAEPICKEVGWNALADESTTTTSPDAMATVAAVIGDLVAMTGQIEGCPMKEIFAGEHWVTGQQTMVDAEGDEWTTEISIDATIHPFGWSFSFSDGSHRVSSHYMHDSPPMGYDIGIDVARFETVFSDSLAGASGGWPDANGTLTITCGP